MNWGEVLVALISAVGGGGVVAIVQAVAARKKTQAEAVKITAEAHAVDHAADAKSIDALTASAERILAMAESRIKHLTDKVSAQEKRISELEIEQMKTMRQLVETQKVLNERDQTIKCLEQEKREMNLKLIEREGQITKLERQVASLLLRVEELEHAKGREAAPAG